MRAVVPWEPDRRQGGSDASSLLQQFIVLFAFAVAVVAVISPAYLREELRIALQQILQELVRVLR